MWRHNLPGRLFLGSFYSLPSPINLSFMWNVGSLLGFVLVVQVVSGLFLSSYYSADTKLAFDTITKTIMVDTNYGWAIRMFHTNSASLFLSLIYIHVGRGVYYKSYNGSTMTWMVGVVVLVLSMSTAFFGYVLPWGQMSFWAATVITNLLSVIPLHGSEIVYWIWGGFSVDNAALGRFYTLHFLLPFLLGFMVLIHLVSLHKETSSNPVGYYSKSMKVFFWPYYSVKDLMGVLFVMGPFVVLAFLYPNVNMDTENFFGANPMQTPTHIKPEWYFLFAYAILRCIPDKGLGVMALAASVMVLFFMPVLSVGQQKTTMYQFVFWVWVMNFVVLTWLGSCHVKYVFIFMAKLSGFIYFFLLSVLMLL